MWYASADKQVGGEKESSVRRGRSQVVAARPTLLGPRKLTHDYVTDHHLLPLLVLYFEGRLNRLFSHKLQYRIVQQQT